MKEEETAAEMNGETKVKVKEEVKAESEVEPTLEVNTDTQQEEADLNMETDRRKEDMEMRVPASPPKSPNHSSNTPLNHQYVRLGPYRNVRFEAMTQASDDEDVPSTSRSPRGRASAMGRGHGVHGSQHSPGGRRNWEDHLSQEDLMKVRDLRMQRILYGRGQINNLNLSQAHEVLEQCLTLHPSLIFEVLNKWHGPSARPTLGPVFTGQPCWCVCGRCREMPTLVERKCCREPPATCISRVPEMEAYVLDEGGLSLARVLWNKLSPVADPQDDAEYARQYRHAAYRQFVAWRCGTLGAGQTVVVIPSCCVWAIRDHFPDPHGQYDGFILRRA
ncbi:uncharacterized protein LOC134437765 [Engraulis encrasicolus]|uniref:uncharacterized protein LOC134437765 n=1 Tax=Engraulis encrasicolus TaxID=184585 RepID=UPI002FCF3E5B